MADHLRGNFHLLRRRISVRGAAMIHDADKTLKSQWLRRFQCLPPEAKFQLKRALQDLREDALKRAEHSWRKHKAPMALYWKVVGVYAGHLARAIN